MTLQILKETPHWIAVNKAAGLISERNRYESPTVEELVWQHLSMQKSKPFLGVVHRLDRVTSGVLIFAKKKSTLKALNAQFSEGRIQKTYLALVQNCPPQKEGTLVHWLEKDQQNKRAIIHHQPHSKAKEVRLRYRILEKIDKGCLLEIRPTTGKFHQIRAQLSAIKCPIVGDVKYGGILAYSDRKIALHAWKLAFQNPSSKEREEIVANTWNF